MKLYREVKASERLPTIDEEWYFTDLGNCYFDFGTWYSTDALDKDSTYELAINWWLESIDITEEEIEKASKVEHSNSGGVVDKSMQLGFIFGVNWALSKLKGDG